ncbi:glycosyltransferase family 4 protein [Vibrio breoganii]
MKTKKILFLINDITMPGGLSRVTLNLVKEFDFLSDEFEVHALSATAKFQSSNHQNIHYLNLPALHGLTAVEKICWYRMLKSRVEEYVEENQYDLVISVGTAMVICTSFCCFHKAELWGAEHLAYNHYGRFRKFLKRWRYPKLTRLICLTESDKELHYDKYLSQVSVIPNFTEFAEIDTTYSNKASILFVGRFNRMKGVDYLVDIIKCVSEQCPRWHFNLYGEGAMKLWMEEQISKSELSAYVTIHNPTKHISLVYQQSGIFILTSRNEGFPMVLLEAQAHGVPVVSFDCETGPSEIITDGEDGYLIPPFDTQAFADRLAELVNDGDLRKSMSEQALINRQRFDKSSIISLWLALFRKSL